MLRFSHARVLGPVSAAAMLTLAALAPACEPGAPGRAAQGSGQAQAGSPEPGSTRPARVVFLGDSLTAGFGLSQGEAYPSLIQQRLRQAGFSVEVVNAGVSGDTSAGGLRRLDWALDGDVRVLVVALGGNDALRGLSVDDLRRNLSEIVERAHARRVTVVLAGMEAPPNLGRAYTSAFRQVYKDVAAKYGIALIPFLLEGVAGVGSLNQGDGIHPNADGARKVAAVVWPFVERAVREAGAHD